MAEKSTFSFGKNWEQFLNEFYSEERLCEAITSLKEFTGMEDIKGKVFMDIGCGTGMFSLAAYKLGAKKVISFDIDPLSVKCCKLLKEKENKPRNWLVSEGSVLNRRFLSRLGKADIVYSWGVLHHTGEMWTAIDNASACVKPGGYAYIALYNNVDGPFGSRFWLGVKRLYNWLPKIGKRSMEGFYTLAFFSGCLATGRNPVRKIREYKSRRGMEWGTDLRDWLGGLPYEYASTSEVTAFLKERGFSLVNLRAAKGTANNHFLFKKD